ncbi:MAG: protocatechuate 3,4-dioxygenase subunit alpha [Bosea sp. (in: a-proteobacteria)]
MSGKVLLGQTPSQTVGPYFAYGLTPQQYGYDWVSIAGPDMADGATQGTRITFEGQVFDGAGQPVTDAMIEIWQADAAGVYITEPGRNTQFTGFGRAGTGTVRDGLFRFSTIKPGAPSVEEAPHINVIVTMRGLLMHTFTRAYFEGDARNAADPVLMQVPENRRDTLLARQTSPGTWRFDVHMQGDAETVFFDL